MIHRFVYLASVGLLLSGACSTSSDSSTVQPETRGQRGESCQARNDCREGLACVNNTCMQNDFNIAPTAKQCDVIECATDEDCCSSFGAMPSFCTDYQTQCDAGDTVYCDLYDSNCTCQFRCDEENRCVIDNTCTDDLDCSGIQTCVGSVCVDCQTTDDCLNTFGSDYQCAGGECVLGCERNEECGLLEECDRGECVDRGCLSDRECIGATGSMLAVCAANGECTVPCENDAECGSQQVCDGGECVFIGCDTDDDCRHLLQVTFQDNVTAVCRE